MKNEIFNLLLKGPAKFFLIVTIGFTAAALFSFFLYENTTTQLVAFYGNMILATIYLILTLGTMAQEKDKEDDNPFTNV